jgi:hypothetical protein
MALFVFGAGATRGASFVDATKHPCLPPVDRDFFTQLQRVQNDKHQKLVQDVMEDVVEIFGNNFDVTMEGVFTTLEHTLRMLETTGETRAFKKKDLRDKRDRLVQAVAVALEDSLTEKGAAGQSTRTPRPCTYHRRFVRDVLDPKDAIVTFNYDCLLDYSLKDWGNKKWNARYGYGFSLGAKGRLLSGDDNWQPDKRAPKDRTVHMFKLHGSLHFDVTTTSRGESVKLKQRPYTKQHGNLRFTIIPPEWHKAYDKGVFSRLWSAAAEAIHRSEHIVFVGYSVPPTDLHSTALFRTAVRRDHLKSLVVVNPDQDARVRTRVLMQRGFTKSTKILSFDYLKEFAAVPRSTWEV